jgi:hypothetical protein
MCFIKRLSVGASLLITMLMSQVTWAGSPVPNWLTPPVSLSTGGRGSVETSIALSSDGKKAVAIWDSDVDSNTQIIQTATANIAGNNATWSPIRNLTNEGKSFSPEISLSADGNQLLAVWSSVDERNTIIQSVSGKVSGNSVTWSNIKDITPREGGAGQPHISISADGTKAVAIWWWERGQRGWDRVMQTASANIKDNSAAWSLIKTLSPEAIYSSGWSDLAISSDGARTTAIWETDVGIQTASATISGNVATWGSINTLTKEETWAHYDPKIALSKDGDKATAIWIVAPLVDGQIAPRLVHTASATIIGNIANWGVVTNLTPNDSDTADVDTLYSRIALSADGAKATAIWDRHNQSSTSTIQTSSATISGNNAIWSETTTIAASLQNVNKRQWVTVPEIKLSSDGMRATALWVRGDDYRSNVVQTSSASIMGNKSMWSTANDLGTYPNIVMGRLGPQLGLSSDGSMSTAIWVSSFTDSENVVQTSSATVAYEDANVPSVTANIPLSIAIVKQSFLVGWTLNKIKKGMPVRVKFAMDEGSFRVIKSTTAIAAGVGAFLWKPKKTQRTSNGLIKICAVPFKGAAEVCSPTINISVQ